jgi:predicted transcriptional regulator YdeE
MYVKLVEKQSFTVIGKLGQGPADKGFQWIPPLWQEANSNFNEISNLAKTDDTGSLLGIWGAMSDVDERFERWKEQGKYLAGCEVVDDAEAPINWTKWTIPSYKYAVVKCAQDTYGDTFNCVVNGYIPQHEYTIIGAVHEFYDPKASNGELYLYFPIQKL